MRWASVFTAPFGHTEPLFMPKYWYPPSLFDLAQRTGFDIESLLFTFAVGGVAPVIYPVATRRRLRSVPPQRRRRPLHRYHYLALAAPFIAFPLLYAFPWNPIYPGIVAMLTGASATVARRPDLKTKTWFGGLLFLGYYTVFLLGLQATAPGYIERGVRSTGAVRCARARHAAGRAALGFRFRLVLVRRVRAFHLARAETDTVASGLFDLDFAHHPGLEMAWHQASKLDSTGSIELPYDISALARSRRDHIRFIMSHTRLSAHHRCVFLKLRGCADHQFVLEHAGISQNNADRFTRFHLNMLGRESHRILGPDFDGAADLGRIAGVAGGGLIRFNARAVHTLTVVPHLAHIMAAVIASGER